MKKICVIGLGYIGLPTAAMFAAKGHTVIGVDLDDNVIANLNKGEITIEEPMLNELVRETVIRGSLKGSKRPEEADFFIICVPTPITNEKKADMTYVEAATRAISLHLKKGSTVILESTSPPKTVDDLLCPILAETGLKLGEELYIAHSPERVLPGNILCELERNDRVVGGINKKSAEIVRDLYKTIVKADIYLTDATTAEMCKLMENTYRDVNIALANEIAKISERLGVNAWEAIELANKHPRVNIHQPGPGVGGHCIAVDPWFIVEKAPDLSRIIRLSRDINDNMPLNVVSKCENILGDVKGTKIIILGATYKPDVDDMRESPITYIINELTKKQAEVIVCDPHVKAYKYNYDCLREHAKGASLIVLGVNHTEFKSFNFEGIPEIMKERNILDTRNFFKGNMLAKLGFNHILLGSGCSDGFNKISGANI